MKNPNPMKHRILTIAITLACLISGNDIYAQETQALTNEAIENYLFNQQYHAKENKKLKTIPDFAIGKAISLKILYLPAPSSSAASSIETG